MCDIFILSVLFILYFVVSLFTVKIFQLKENFFVEKALFFCFPLCLYLVIILAMFCCVICNVLCIDIFYNDFLAYKK